MGTPAFAATILAGLLGAGHRILAVYSQPPRPAGRGHRPQPSPVQAMAAAQGIPVRHPERLRGAEIAAEFAGWRADAAVVAAYGLILPRAFLAAPRLGCVNVHASLLPRWRGAAPVQRALLDGDAETGITIMQMEEGLDTGPLLLQERVPIAADMTASGLAAELAVIGARLAVAALDGLDRGTLAARPQPQEGVRYAAKIERGEGVLDWRLPASSLERRIRALEPWPGTFFTVAGPGGQSERIRVLAAAAVPGVADMPPGTVVDERLSIACGDGVLRPLRLQRPGRGPLETPAFLRGFPIGAGTVLPPAGTSGEAACPATS
jgi:methionyl-tRNA formyltransferase